MTSVVGSSIKVVFCEGVAGGLDTTLLSYRIIPPGDQTLIKPVGGKYAMRAFIEGYLANFEKVMPNYLGFRDRDFDILPTDKPALIRLTGDKEIWTTHKSCIESYFVDAELLYQYWSNGAQNTTWKYGSPPKVDEIEVMIVDAARQLADYQAIRWALARLKPGQRWPEIRTSWTRKGSGQLPPNLDFKDCLKEAQQLVKAFLEEVKSIDIQKLEEEAKVFQQNFSDEDFYHQRKHLIWFQGKDLLAKLLQKIQDYLIQNRLRGKFPLNSYTQWAAKNLDISKYPDLQELVLKITT